MQINNSLVTGDLVRNGIRVYAYPGMTHVKAALYDGWACVGSANFDKMSLHVGPGTGHRVFRPADGGPPPARII